MKNSKDAIKNLEKAIKEGAFKSYACKDCGAVPGEEHKSTCPSRTCTHCHCNKDIRNPSGYCDHLYYPESCEVCSGKMKKTIKVLIEIPTNWFDYESPLGLASISIRDRLDRLLEEKVVEKAVKKMDISSIKVTKKEIKERILDILARRALETKEDL